MYDHGHETVKDFIQDEAFKTWVITPTPELESHWSNWLAQNPEKSATVARAKELLLRLDFDSKEVSQSRKQEIYRYVLSETKKDKAVANGISKNKDSVISWLPSIFKAMAASIILFLAGWLLFIAFESDEGSDAVSENQPFEVEWITRKVEYGKKLTLNLSDGSLVKLNAGSTLRFPTSFSDTIREVFLEGEAYFEVEKDSIRGFVVRTDEVDTRVLGTSFNIRESYSDNTVEVAVVEGKVSVAPKHTDQQALLQSNERAIYSIQKKVMEKSAVDISAIIAWKNGTIVFKEADLEEMIGVLSRWYGYDFQVKGDRTTQRKFSGYFHNKTIDNVLDKLAYSSAFQYRLNHKEKKATIFPQ